MKILKYLTFAVTMLLAVSSCEVENKDAFSTAPIAPELNAHGKILMTSNTMNENVNFSWNKARFAGDELQYELTAIYGEGETAKSFILTKTQDLFFMISKTDFKALLYEQIPELPINDTFKMSFVVSTMTTLKDKEPVKLESNVITIEIYAFGDAISSVVTPLSENIILDMNNPGGEVLLLSWTEAKLIYGETITYSVRAAVSGSDNEPAILDEDINGLSYSSTVDALNEQLVALGATEGKECAIDFYVYAHCESLPDGVASTAVTIPVTTYIATFPETLWLPGNYQGWSPETAPTLTQSTAVKGAYEGVIDLTTIDGSDVEFKFSPYPEWKDDFGGKVEVSTFGDGYNVANGTIGVSDNIKVPSGLYNIFLSKKYNTIQMIQIDVLGLTGDACGEWGVDVDMTYEPDAHRFVTTANMVQGKEFKIRFNHDWTYSIGSEDGSETNVSTQLGNNIKFNGESGEYKVILDVSKAPYSIKFISTTYPEYLYIPGNHQGWNPATAPKLYGDGNGVYEGFADLDGEFKFTLGPSWGDGELAGDLDNLVSQGGGNLSLPKALYYLQVDMNAGKCTYHLPITRVGAIGSFNGWGTPDAELIRNDTIWEGTLDLPENTEMKFRMNDNWSLPDAFNMGGDLNNLTYDGANIKVSEAGTYKVTLSFLEKPWKATIVKQ